MWEFIDFLKNFFQWVSWTCTRIVPSRRIHIITRSRGLPSTWVIMLNLHFGFFIRIIYLNCGKIFSILHLFIWILHRIDFSSVSLTMFIILKDFLISYRYGMNYLSERVCTMRIESIWKAIKSKVQNLHKSSICWKDVKLFYYVTKLSVKFV